MVELSARRVAEQLPRNRHQLNTVADRFNAEFKTRWDQIIEFLKLHYVLSQRTDTDYWIDHRRPSSVPDDLLDKLEEWRFRCPWHQDERRVDEMFPAASYQYVLYGMEFHSAVELSIRRDAMVKKEKAASLLKEVRQQAAQFTAHLPPHRQLLEQAATVGFASR
jgi:hypothetical protein